MVHASESAQEEAVQQPAPKGGSSGLGLKIIPKLPAMIRDMWRMDPDEERYVRPPRSYELPEYRQGMKHCTSKERYLRRVRFCNYREPEVIALADELGAYELSDYEFAKAAYWWMKTHMWYELSDFYGPGKTLRTGTGACLHYNNTYIALCRCAGIKARFKSYKMKFRRLEREVFTDVDPQFASMFDASGGVIQEAETEVLIDGDWVVAYVPQTAMLTAASGWPISEFGESSLGTYFDALPGSIQRFETLSFVQGVGAKLMTKVAPATMERLNARMKRVQDLGRQELKDAGGIEGYNRIAKKKREFYSPDEILDQQALKHYDKIIINKSKKAVK